MEDFDNDDLDFLAGQTLSEHVADDLRDEVERLKVELHNVHVDKAIVERDVDVLRDALHFVKIAIMEANDSGIIMDTIWATPSETLFDYIDDAIQRTGDQQ